MPPGEVPACQKPASERNLSRKALDRLGQLRHRQDPRLSVQPAHREMDARVIAGTGSTDPLMKPAGSDLLGFADGTPFGSRARMLPSVSSRVSRRRDRRRGFAELLAVLARNLDRRGDLTFIRGA